MGGWSGNRKESVYKTVLITTSGFIDMGGGTLLFLTLDEFCQSVHFSLSI